MFETTGYLREEAKDFLLVLSKVASEARRIPSGILYNYFLKRLSMRLQQGVSTCINRRLDIVKSHNSAAAHDPSFCADVIVTL